ncbi:MAG: VUT family protein [Hyphomonadaceae bacterium]
MSASNILAFVQQPHIAIPVVAVTVAAFLLARKPATAIYVGLMPLINWAFAGIDTISIPPDLGGGEWHPFTIVTGLVLVVRDFAQREIKHWIFGAMLVGLALSTLTAWPVIVVASGVAFLISETADWAVYTFSNRPLSQRIMISSLVGAPIDQVAFIGLASFVVPDIFAWGTILTGIVSKLVGAWVVSRIVAAREARAVKNEMNPA